MGAFFLDLFMGGLLSLMLLAIELGIPAVQADQRRMVAPFGYAAPIQHKDFVAVLQGGKPVGHDDGRTALKLSLIHISC